MIWRQPIPSDLAESGTGRESGACERTDGGLQKACQRTNADRRTKPV